jgi:hypothetical protein
MSDSSDEMDMEEDPVHVNEASIIHMDYDTTPLDLDLALPAPTFLCVRVPLATPYLVNEFIAYTLFMHQFIPWSAFHFFFLSS